MLLEDVSQVVLRGLLIIQNWTYCGATRGTPFKSPQEGDCLLIGLVNIIIKATLSTSYSICI